MLCPINYKIRTIWEWLKKLQGEYYVKEATVSGLKSRIKILQLKVEPFIEKTFLPDLIITNIIPTLYYDYAKINIIIKNIGKKISVGCNLHNELNGNLYNLNIPALNPDQEISLSFDFPYNPEGDSKVYQIISVADSTNLNIESNENNNTLIKNITLKETVLVPTGIIVHCHNPEGKEINSITGVGQSAKIYDGDTLIGYGAYNSATHNQLISLSAGSHTIKVKFNGITLEQEIYLQPGEIKSLVFTFTRISFGDILLNFTLQHGEEVYGLPFPYQGDWYLGGLLTVFPEGFNDYFLQIKNWVGTFWMSSIINMRLYGNIPFTSTSGCIVITPLSVLPHPPNTSGWTLWYTSPMPPQYEVLVCNNVPYDLDGNAV